MTDRNVNSDGSHVVVGQNDVLLGRGNHLTNSGNENFLNIVRSRSTEYWSRADNAGKDGVARQVVDTIKLLGGRFLYNSTKRVEIMDARTKGAPNTAGNWEVASNHTVLIKVKQTFRDIRAAAKKRIAIAKVIQNSSRFSSMPSVPFDQQSIEARMPQALSTALSSENAAVRMSSFTSRIPKMAPVNGINVNNEFRDHDSSAEARNNPMPSSSICLSIESVHRNDQGMLPESKPKKYFVSNEINSQSFGFERDNHIFDEAASFPQSTDESILQQVQVHRNRLDQKMLEVMHEQQSRFQTASHFASVPNVGTNVGGHIDRMYHNDTTHPFHPAQLLQQQQHRSSLSHTHHLNLDAHQLPPPSNLSYQDVPLPPFQNIVLPQHCNNLDVLLSQLSPSEVAIIRSTFLANPPFPLSMQSLSLLPQFDHNSGNRENNSSARMLSNLQQQHLRDREDVFGVDTAPKSDSDEDQKPAGRR